MGSMAKAEGINQDRITQLPDDIVSHIFSFLPTVDAVRNTLLSKKFNQVWTKLQTLDFDSEREFQKCRGGTAFLTFVSRVLYFRDGSEIRTFRLKLSRKRYLPCVGDWICTAVKRKVVELDLHLNFDVWTDFELPPCIFWCKTLEVLKLNLSPWEVTDDIPTSGCFPILKFLHVTVFNPSIREMEKLLSHFPVLEELTIDGTGEDLDDFGTCSFQVSASKLKTLRISLESLSEPVDIHVNAPQLESLDLQRLGLTNCFLDGSANSLVNASIAFREKFEIKGLFDLSDSTMELLNQVSDVKSLSVSAHCLEDLHLPENYYLPSFGNVNQLRLAFGDHSCWELLARFLNSAPNLEILVLDDRTEGHKELSEIHWNPPEQVPSSLLSNLKTICFKGFKGRLFEMEMIKYLLKNGQLLNKMTISTGLHLSYDRQNDLYTEFMMFHRAATCHVEFMYMEV
ncbi:putative F-box domain, FBD domain, leucine-rich repeat domain, L domain-containing protein [Rosa chinensis]|uniref:Putative F-box domain, FBD domain, leucine-rich repeat domain, L domain-containing protein n=1 Tax=Rosa chinensis TaxID=74649 RepID=A0A2P6QHK1_ROSCH|nr:FBD-associated F-box protein At4g10400 isoform X1 [Rosa chinensis]XP_040375607.1 FBD-associated F-box protein At4g10400 isoform X1 [Rosa chinensis]XP_040375608.1 FBD-associated F-box protein At4g10400 isoform X1 [Rosa chinensis]XP_040375609.1 FBD-associated F-box protein At4g10400 isoform X1 [Rosa chinensis]PRQ33652.1 putative F-box domain, FBD domain, leucine-rich repeat domain, L domain-containing protein [Rosa chinensis]